MNLHSTKTDNTSIKSKINLRRLAVAGLDEIRVLDLFAGENRLWESFKKARYYGVEKVKGKGRNLTTDNIRAIQSLDLSAFNVIDVDSYGIPANQIYELYQNGTMQDGTVVVYTCITNKMSGLNRCILDMFNLRAIFKKSKTMLTGQAVEMFYGMLYSLGVRKVCEYEIKQEYEKHYGFFVV